MDFFKFQLQTYYKRQTLNSNTQKGWKYKDGKKYTTQNSTEISILISDKIDFKKILRNSYTYRNPNEN